MPTPQTFGELVVRLLEIIDILVLVVFALTFLVIAWNIINAWVINGGEPEGVKKGKQSILYSFVVLIVMVSVWGIVALLRSVIV